MNGTANEPSPAPGGPLSGVVVVDLSQYLSGPTVTRLMAELGAEIIKVEIAPHGDPARQLQAIKNGRSGFFVQQNRGKQSICINIDDEDGRRVFDDLLERADVFVENLGPGVLEKRGFDWESVLERHPSLIVASVTGFGRQGALSDRTAFDLIAQAFSGLMYLTGEADGPPMPVGSSFADVIAGVHALAAIGIALFERQSSGLGQHLDISMVDSLFHCHEMAIQGPSLTEGRFRPKRGGSKSRYLSPMGAFQGPEGWIALQVLQPQWPAFCRAIGRPDLEHDERFNDVRGRHKNRDELNALIEQWMQTCATDDEVVDILAAQRVPVARVIEPIAAVEHPHFVSRDMVRVVDDPALGRFVVPGNPLRFSRFPEVLDLVAPDLGEHTRSILADLGYDESMVDDLERSGAVIAPSDNDTQTQE